MLRGRTRYVVAAIVLLVAAALGALGGYATQRVEVDGLRAQLRAERSRLVDLGNALGERDGRISGLTADKEALVADKDALRADKNDLTARLNAKEAELALGDSAGARAILELETLRADFDEMSALFEPLDSQYRALQSQVASLVPVESFGLTGSVLFFESAGVASAIAPLCTGSMEPTISCDDLLILYKPALSDLDVGDIVSFRMPTADCSGFVPTTTTLLHRIRRVIQIEGKIFLETKGDATPDIDRCIVPTTAVEGKVLAIVYDSRLAR